MRKIYMLRHSRGEKISRYELEDLLNVGLKKSWVSYVNKVYANRNTAISIQSEHYSVSETTIHQEIIRGGKYTPSIKSLYDAINA